MRHRFATVDDAPTLAALNSQLVEDEGHRNTMSVAQLEQRMRRWLGEEGYTAAIFEEDGSEIVAYALFRISADGLYLRQFFVVRERRRQGIGRACMDKLSTEIWPRDRRITVDVLTSNEAAIAFWREVGFADYCLTLEIQPRG